MTSRWMMSMLLAAGLLVGAVSTSAQQPQTTFTLTALLLGSNETPAPINTGAFGTATVVVDLVAQTVTYTVNVFNLPSGVTAGHIHVGGPGTSGPTVVNFTVRPPESNDFTITGTVPYSQFTMRPDQGIRSPEDMIQAILGGNSYANIHSQVNPGGEIRGQLLIRQ